LYLLSNTIKLLNVLDEYEEFDPESSEKSLFVREHVTVKLKDKEITSYAYLYNKPVDSKKRIASGDYLKG
jgi:pyruvate carboxylase